jgi:acyl-coenzyme A synthetase/AMP-(fatty) acid ligase
VRYGTTGWPVPGYDIELRGEDGGPVPDGEPGDLYIQGPSAAMMYWGNRTKTRETFQGGWTKSGDKYMRNADGSYTYGGRSDDMLKVSGIYVSPFEVEATLVQHPAVLEAAVIGVPDAEGLTKTKAFVVLKPGSRPPKPSSRPSSRTGWRPTSTRARSSSWPSCPRRPPARSSASSCASAKRAEPQRPTLSQNDASEPLAPRKLMVGLLFFS